MDLFSLRQKLLDKLLLVYWYAWDEAARKMQVYNDEYQYR